MKIRRESTSGFTLIELLVVIVIIGILAMIAIPHFFEYQARGFDSRSLSDLRNAATAEEAYYADNELYIDCIGTCSSSLPGFTASNGVTVDMFDVPAAGGVPEHFTGRSYHADGLHKDIASAWMWNSSQGGLQ